MVPFPYINRVIIRRESGQGDPDAHVLTGSASDLREVLDELRAAVDRVATDGNTNGFHAVVVGDGSARYEFSHIAVRIDPDIRKHQQRTRWLWRFYDSNLAGVVGMVLMLLVIIGLGAVYQWVLERW
jgi:hypothetical protein